MQHSLTSDPDNIQAATRYHIRRSLRLRETARRLIEADMTISVKGKEPMEELVEGLSEAIRQWALEHNLEMSSAIKVVRGMS